MSTVYEAISKAQADLNVIKDRLKANESASEGVKALSNLYKDGFIVVVETADCDTHKLASESHYCEDPEGLCRCVADFARSGRAIRLRVFRPGSFAPRPDAV